MKYEWKTKLTNVKYDPDEDTYSYNECFITGPKPSKDLVMLSDYYPKGQLKIKFPLIRDPKPDPK
tara:strand:- start:1306 stop:1500 length:195 start_codon:yes stop_codon:yes gene_type:complete